MKKLIKFFRRHFRPQMNQSGVTLVEVMIAAGLASVVSLAVMRISDNSTKTIKKMESDAELRYFIDSVVRKQLSSEVACKNTLNDADVYDVTIAGPLPALRNENNNIVVQPGSTTSGYPRFNRFWLVTDMQYLGFIPDAAGSNVGTCRISFTYARNSTFKVRGVQQRTMNYEVTCKIDGGTPSVVQSCVLANATSEGMWTKEFTDNFALINYNDVPNGFVSIGTPFNLDIGAEAPLEIFLNTAGGDKKISWYQPGYSFGMQIPLDSVYSFTGGNWGITESGTNNDDKCLNFLAYDDSIAGSEAVYPYVRLCEDKNYFKGGMTILGSLGTYIEPSSLEIQNGSLVCTDTNYANSTGSASGAGTEIPNVYICGNSNSTVDSNAFISGLANNVDAGAFSLILGSQNSVVDDARANLFYSSSYDDLNFVLGSTNYVKGSHNLTFGKRNTNDFVNSKMLGTFNRAFYTSSTNPTMISSFMFGYNNQVRTASNNTHFYTFGFGNFMDYQGMAIGGNHINTNYSDVFMLGFRGVTERKNEMVISSETNRSTNTGGRIRFAVSDNTTETYRNAVELTSAKGTTMSAGALNTGNITKNYRGEALLTRSLSDPADQSTASSTTRRDRYNNAIMASSHSDNYATRSFIGSCYDCLIRDTDDNVTQGHVILGSSESDVTGEYYNGIYSSYLSRIYKKSDSAPPAQIPKGSAIVGGGMHEIRSGENTAIIGGYQNKLLCSESKSCNSDVIIGGSENTIKESSTANGTFNNIITGGNKNMIQGNASGVTTYMPALNAIVGGLGSTIKGSYNSMIGGGMRNTIENGNMNFICGGYDNKIYSTSPSSMVNYNTILGGRNINIANGAWYNRVFGSYVSILANQYGNLVLTDYDNDGSKLLTVNGNQNFYGRFRNGYYLYTSSDSVTGVKYLHASTTWASVSSKEKKENFQDLNFEKILHDFNHMNIQKWNFKGDDPSQWHIGPTAQDFYSTFKVNNDEKRIGEFDINGVSLAGTKAIAIKHTQNKKNIKELSLFDKIIKELKNKILALVDKIEDLFNKQEVKLSELERSVARIERSDAKEKQR